MRSRLLAFAGLVVGLLSPLSSGWAQTSEPAAVPAVQIDVFLSLGYGALIGGPSEGGAWGPGSLGVGLEHRLKGSGALRLEAFVLNGQAKLGETGLFAQPTTVLVNHVGLGASYRWYGRRGVFLGAGATLSRVYLCDVDTEGGPGFFGGETVSCKDFAEIPLSAAENVAGLVATGGIIRGAVSIGARVEAGLQPSVRAAAGDMRVLNVGVVVQYRFRNARSSLQPTRANPQSAAVVR